MKVTLSYQTTKDHYGHEREADIGGVPRIGESVDTTAEGEHVVTNVVWREGDTPLVALGET